MKLLLDQNLSRRLLHDLGPVFPGSSHVQLLQLDRVLDAEIWSFAQNNGYAIVTKDSDFVELAALRGHPPKIVWLNLGNVANSVIRSRLVERTDAIVSFLGNTVDAVLELE